LISLSVAQLRAAMNYAAHQESQCTASVLDVLSRIVRAQKLLNGDLGSEVDTSIFSAVDETLAGLSKEARNAVTALQFVDALAQRLSHIEFALKQIGEFANSGRRPDSVEDWTRLLERIRAMYSIHEEREVFDAVMENASIGKLIDADNPPASSVEDSVELF
jgi:hypothetical protein